MRKVALAVAVSMIVVLAVGISMAAEQKQMAKVEKYSGEVMNVNHAAGSIEIKVGTVEHALTAQPKLLSGIKVGDKVDFEQAGKALQSIKVAAVPAPKSKY